VDELDRLSLKSPDRMALHQVDSLVNLHSHTLINTCVRKLAAAARGSSTTYLGQFVQFDSNSYRDVRIAFLKAMPGYFTFHQASGDAADDAPFYRIALDRVPWFHTGHEDVVVKVKKGYGLVPPDHEETNNEHRAA
jgi:hypothetical protein